MRRLREMHRDSCVAGAFQGGVSDAVESAG